MISNEIRETPAVVWLRVTDYMHGWLTWELCGVIRIKDQYIVCAGHLDGVRDILMRETETDSISPGKVGNSMSSTLYDCVYAGATIDEGTVKELYGISRDELKLYMPIECPRMCLTDRGVLRPWSKGTNLRHRQAVDLQKLLRDRFWQAVTRFDKRYATEHKGENYPASEMIEAFCDRTRTPESYVAAIRREWQRREKEQK